MVVVEDADKVVLLETSPASVVEVDKPTVDEEAGIEASLVVVASLVVLEELETTVVMVSLSDPQLGSTLHPVAPADSPTSKQTTHPSHRVRAICNVVTADPFMLPPVLKG